MVVCLIVTLPGIPLNFDTPSQSLRVQHSLKVILIVVLADSLINFDTCASQNYCQRMHFGGAPLKILFGRISSSPGPKWFLAEMTRNWCCSAVRCGHSFH